MAKKSTKAAEPTEGDPGPWNPSYGEDFDPAEPPEAELTSQAVLNADSEPTPPEYVDPHEGSVASEIEDAE